MPEKRVQCPHCDEIFKLDLPEAPPADLGKISRKELEELLAKVGSPVNMNHRHKTADDFLDCPECRLWFDKTATHYQVKEKEPEPPPETPPPDQPGEGEKKPGDKEPAIGSVFSTKSGEV